MEKRECEEFRRKLKIVADEMNLARRQPPEERIFTDLDLARRHSEAIANLTLAFRHVEDASMRLGKAIQALDGGVSVYDKAQTPEI